MNWRLAHSLEVLRNEVNAAFPLRDKAADGTIGDAAHAATASDHNPNAAGVVCAFDITTDLRNDGTSAAMFELTEWFRTHPHPDIKYLIFSGRMFSAYPRPPYGPFEWRPYTGADPHTGHAHVSVGVGRDGQSVQPYDDLDSWRVAECFSGAQPTPAPEDDMTDGQAKQLTDVANAVFDPANGISARLARLEGDFAAAFDLRVKAATELGLREMFGVPADATPAQFQQAVKAALGH